jgi:hypothetical protein
MRAVTGYCRLPILAIAAILIAGCGATSVATFAPSLAAVGPSPSAAGSDVPSPLPGVESLAPTVAPAASPIPSPTGPSGDSLCPSTLDPNEPVVGLWDDSGLVRTDLEIRSVARVTDPGAPLAIPAAMQVPSPVSLVGGREAIFSVTWYASSWHHITRFTRFRATLTIEGRDPVDLPIRFESQSGGKANVAIANVPDVGATGQIDIRLEFRDPCFIVAGRVSSPVRIYSVASVADCPRGRDAAFDELGDQFEPPIHIGGVAANHHPWLFTGKVAELGVIDPLPPYVGFDRDSQTLEAAPGATVDVVNPNESLELHPAATYEVIFFRRGPLLRWIENGWIHGDEPDAEIVFRSKLVQLPDGTFSFETPMDPARYVAQVLFAYDAACSIGHSGAGIGIDIVAPAP